MVLGKAERDDPNRASCLISTCQVDQDDSRREINMVWLAWAKLSLVGNCTRGCQRTRMECGASSLHCKPPLSKAQRGWCRWLVVDCNVRSIGRVRYAYGLAIRSFPSHNQCAPIEISRGSYLHQPTGWQMKPSLIGTNDFQRTRWEYGEQAR